LFESEASRRAEWRDWIANAPQSRSVYYWLGAPPTQPRLLGTGRPLETLEAGEWWVYRQSGIAVCESGFWWLRWDLSPLGYLATAAHGHLDALHLSVWYRGVAIVVDPGTGAYYADSKLRSWLASREAHNGPCPLAIQYPRRHGAFLWSGHHAPPAISRNGRHWMAVLSLPGCAVSRSVEWSKDGQSWTVVDSCQSTRRLAAVPFAVRWHFAPAAIIKKRGERGLVVSRQGIEIEVRPGEEWSEVELLENSSDREKLQTENPLAGIVSPAFRKGEWAPYLRLVGQRSGDKPCVFRTTFLACGDS
jgi:hypothetical protein